MVDVLKIQKQLNEINFTSRLTEDGIQGNNTNNAIERFKSQFGEVKFDGFALNRVIKNKTNGIKHVVPYVTQLTGYKNQYRMCNLACVDMLLKSYGILHYTSETLDYIVDNNTDIEEFADKKFGKIPVAMQEKLEQYSQVLAYLTTLITGEDFTEQYLSISDIKNKLDNGIPLILATKLSGFESKNENAGHYVVCVGYFGDNFIINDPYGFYEKYHTSNQKVVGEKVVIHKDVIFGKFGCKTKYSETLKHTDSDKYLYRCVSSKNKIEYVENRSDYLRVK